MRFSIAVLPDATVAQADRLARELHPGVRRDDPRRGRALVQWTLARHARDGHTISSAGLVADGIRPFGIDPEPAIGAALLTDDVVSVPAPDGRGDEGGWPAPHWPAPRRRSPRAWPG